MVGRAVECDGLDCEARSEQKEFLRMTKTAGWKDPSKTVKGWLAERSNATVLKTADGATHPGVRIPHHPPQ